MTRTVQEYIEMCQWDTARFFIFSDNVFAQLIYYSHLLPLAAILLFAIFVFINNRKSLPARWLFATSILLSAWLLSDLVLWAHEKPSVILFFWSLMILAEPMIYAGILYFVYALVDNKYPSSRATLFIFLLFLPLIALLPTTLTLTGYNLSNCWREPIEGPMAFYPYVLGGMFTVWVFLFGVKRYLDKKDPGERQKIVLIIGATMLLLLSFTLGNTVGSLLVDWSIGQYGLFGIPVFIALLSYLVVRFQALNIKLVGAQALMATLWILIISVLFVRTIESIRIIIAITGILLLVLGIALVRSVKREITQRELIQKQEQELVNKQQENLLHFISHEIKGYLTKSEAGFAAIAEGDYGAIPEQLKTMATSALSDVRKGGKTVMEILDSSNMKKGTVDYKMQTFDFRTAVKEIVGHLKRDADKKGLTMDISISREGEYRLTGDEGKLRQHVIRNLEDNAIKYTPKGHIEVHLSDGDGKIHFSVKDNGVGITPEHMKNLFTEGGHGKDSIKINVHSTGYGLFIAKQVVDMHGGKIWAESEGEGKGSRFVVELPASS